MRSSRVVFGFVSAIGLFALGVTGCGSSSDQAATNVSTGGAAGACGGSAGSGAVAGSAETAGNAGAAGMSAAGVGGSSGNAGAAAAGGNAGAAGNAGSAGNGAGGSAGSAGSGAGGGAGSAGSGAGGGAGGIGAPGTVLYTGSLTGIYGLTETHAIVATDKGPRAIPIAGGDAVDMHFFNDQVWVRPKAAINYASASATVSPDIWTAAHGTWFPPWTTAYLMTVSADGQFTALHQGTDVSTTGVHFFSIDGTQDKLILPGLLPTHGAFIGNRLVVGGPVGDPISGQYGAWSYENGDASALSFGDGAVIKDLSPERGKVLYTHAGSLIVDDAKHATPVTMTSANPGVALFAGDGVVYGDTPSWTKAYYVEAGQAPIPVAPGNRSYTSPDGRWSMGAHTNGSTHLVSNTSTKTNLFKTPAAMIFTPDNHVLELDSLGGPLRMALPTDAALTEIAPAVTRVVLYDGALLVVGADKRLARFDGKTSTWTPIADGAVDGFVTWDKTSIVYIEGDGATATLRVTANP